nr:MAG: hypothetical protein [Bacteriophage sp.]
MRKLFDKNSENRSISIDKYATASYNITIIKQNNLIKSKGRRRNYQLGKKGKKQKTFQKEKELLEIENLKLQKREKLASIISTIVIMIVSVITAILKWLGLID